MEELRSTEILDKEIEADARKKVEKILATADAECQKLLDAVDSKVQAAAAEKKRYYEEKLAVVSADLDAAVPLEEERFLAEFYASSVAEAYNAYFAKLDDEKLLSLVETLLARSKDALADRKVRARVFGFAPTDAKKLVEKHCGAKNLLSCEETTFAASGDEAVPLNEVHKGIILESEDGEVRCRLTTDQLIGELTDRHSMELATTLFGGRLPQ